MPLPIADSMPGRAARTSLATVTVLALGPLMIRKPMLNLPLVRVIVSAGTETTCTVPSWSILTGAAGLPVFDAAAAGVTVIFPI